MLDGTQFGPLEVRRVAMSVNNVRNNGAELLEPVNDEADQPLELALA